MKQDPRTYVYTQITKGLGVKLTSGKLNCILFGAEAEKQ